MKKICTQASCAKLRYSPSKRYGIHLDIEGHLYPFVFQRSGFHCWGFLSIEPSTTEVKYVMREGGSEI